LDEEPDRGAECSAHAGRCVGAWEKLPRFPCRSTLTWDVLAYAHSSQGRQKESEIGGAWNLSAPVSRFERIRRCCFSEPGLPWVLPVLLSRTARSGRAMPSNGRRIAPSSSVSQARVAGSAAGFLGSSSSRPGVVMVIMSRRQITAAIIPALTAIGRSSALLSASSRRFLRIPANAVRSDDVPGNFTTRR
jgi:hypothetical protein